MPRMVSEHYFSESPKSKHAPRTWTYQLRGNIFTFTSDEGVFSKNKVDYGTRILLESIENPKVEGSILDLGCGYGPIGLTLAKEWQDRQVVMTDINERAVCLSKQNKKANNVQNAEVLQSDQFKGIPDRKFALIVTNPPIRAGKKVVHQLFESSKLTLKENGEIWVVIQKKQGAPSAQKKLQELFGNVEIVTRSKGYYILRALNH